MPKFIVLSSHGNGGGVFVEPGDVIDLDATQGRWRTGIGLVKPYVEPTAPPAETVAAPEPAAEEAVSEPAPAAETPEVEAGGESATEGNTPRRRSGRS